MLEPCNKEVFEKGISLGFVDMTKEQAELILAKLDERWSHHETV